MARNARRQRALEILAMTGMAREKYVPPLHEFLWRRGVDVRPPHFASFVANALWMGTWFGALMTVAMVPITFVLVSLAYPGTEIPIAVILAACAGGGVAFGIIAAAHFAIGRRKYRLPAWEALPAS